MLVTITSVEQCFTKNGDEYKKVHGVTPDGHETTKSVFNQLAEKWELLQEDNTVDFTMEKKGQFWNVKDIKMAADSLPPPPKPLVLPEHDKVIEAAVKSTATAEKPTAKDEEREYWLEKDRITRKSIERQSSLNAAIELAKLHPEKATSRIIVATAKFFEAYLEGESKLVQEAKKQGAVEL